MATRMQRNTQQQRGSVRGGNMRSTRRTGQQRTSTKSNGQKFGVDDLTYDLVSILHEKSKGLEALGKYMQDAEDNEEVMQLIQRIQEQDREQVQELRDCLADVMRGSNGGF
jgi:hypothetical protein